LKIVNYPEVFSRQFLRNGRDEGRAPVKLWDTAVTQPGQSLPFPTIVVIIATRNRGSSAVRTVRTVLANTYPSFKVLVIDQSDNTATNDALDQFKSDPRFIYIHTETVGLARAHNFGISQYASELVAITDDDCEVPPDWLDQIVASFGQTEKIGMLFGNTIATSHDTSKGFVPQYLRTTPRIQRSSWQFTRVRGMGACMALRRKAWLAVGGFDGIMGCGAPMLSGEDADMAVRLSLKGYQVLETPQVQVLHYGYRTFSEGRQTIYRDAFGIGATLIKPLRTGHFSILPLFLYEFFWLTLRPVLWNVVCWHRPFRFTMLRGFVAGVKAGLTRPLDAIHCSFRDK
jgi:GT2 family glycosyltransferase